MKSFKLFISENKPKEVTVVWCDCNPPTSYHQEILFDEAEKISKNKDYKIYLTLNQNKKTDPLDYFKKIKYVRKMFPRHSRKVIMNDSVVNIFHLITLMHNQGYERINIISNKLTKNQTKEILLYDNVKINIIETKNEDIEVFSAKLRKAAADNDFLTFMKGIPPDFEEAKSLFNEVRKGLGLNESHFFRKHIELETISEERESFVSGDLFKVGEIVIIKETCETAKISRLGTNYLVLTDKNNNTSRKWIHQVEKLNNTNESTIEDRIRDQAERKKEKDAERLERDLGRAREADKREAELEAEREAERKEREKEEQEKRQQRQESIRSILKLMR